MNDLSNLHTDIILVLIATELKDPKNGFDKKELLKLQQALTKHLEQKRSNAPNPNKKKRTLEDTIAWLKFRDEFIAGMNGPLTCLYCQRALFSDAPRMPCKPKDHVFRRKKHIPRQDIATIDHVIPLSKGGERFDPNNLVVACHSCNSKKGDTILENNP